VAEFSLETLTKLGLAPAQPTVTRKEQLGQSEFLKLMTTQLANQDPFQPMENGEFIGQMAQFSTVTGLESLTQSFGALARTLSQGQALQAVSLVGRNALVPTEFGTLSGAEGATLAGAVELPSSASGVNIEVLDATGQSVQRIALGTVPAGLQDFTWDGSRADGTQAPPGIYQFRAVAQTAQGNEAVETFMNARIDSVAIGSDNKLQLSVAGLGTVDFGDVRRVG